MPRFNDLRVKTSWGQSLSDSDNIESFTPTSGSTIHIPSTGDVYCYVEKSLPEHSPGQLRISATGAASYTGFEQVRYRQPLCHVDTYNWLVANKSGQVTAYLKTDSSAYETWNAMLRFEIENDERTDWLIVTWVFTLVEES